MGPPSPFRCSNPDSGAPIPSQSCFRCSNPLPILIQVLQSPPNRDSVFQSPPIVIPIPSQSCDSGVPIPSQSCDSGVPIPFQS
ncbi:unnamed protein product [Staurois parvus]|uniref:Uncharacterized protein n=1 Tax=Staurois parvus TaxID=386267 RepID=A0ABN9H998_9NEOB|nr:unnamed protein product [Staurois parvus]